jgi:hypothetical protein
VTRKGCYQGDKCAFKNEKNYKGVRSNETNTDDLEIKSLKVKVEESNETIENQSNIIQIKNHEEDNDKIVALEESLKHEEEKTMRRWFMM